MKQRAVMAIATALEPKVIVADEPTSALDVVVQRQVMQTLGRLQDGLGAAVVLIGHDMGLIAQFADTVGRDVRGQARRDRPGRQIDRSAAPSLHPPADRQPARHRERSRRCAASPACRRALLDLPPGVRFHPRCPFAFDRCRARDAAAQEVGAGPGARPATSIRSSDRLPPPLDREPAGDGVIVSALIELQTRRASSYGAFTALDDVSLSLSRRHAASMTAIAGESGSGKTTLARLLLGFITPTPAQVLYRGRDLATMSGAEQRQFRREVQPIFQDPFDVFNPFYRVDHVLTTPLRSFGLAGTPAEARAMIEEALELVGLRPGETLGPLSRTSCRGGQRQRIMVARALLLRPADHHGRRAGLDGRRLAAGDDPRRAAHAQPRARDLARLHHPRPDHRLPDLRQHRGPLPRARSPRPASVERVIREPKHPYTQLLVSSIPLPDLSRRWGTLEAFR